MDNRLDNHPYVFLMEIMQHEAHRHPYIEMFGVLCLMKLKHGAAFITRAGSAWRLLMLSMLMPWIVKYRRMTRSKLSHEDGLLSAAFVGFQNLRKNDAAPITLDKDTDENQDDEQVIMDLKQRVQQLQEKLLLSEATNQKSRRFSRSSIIEM